MGAGRSEALVVTRRNSVSSSRSSSGYQSEVADEVDGHGWPTQRPSRHTHTSHIQTQASSGDIDAVKETARLLALDIADYMLKPSVRLKCRHAATLRRVVDELSSRHEIIFSSIARKLGIRVAAEGPTAARWRYTFIAVASELFADGRNNWGRVVTIYAFAGWLVRQHCTAETSSDELAHIIAVTAGDFVADKLADWICRQGGWDAMEMYFPAPHTYESLLWRGLLVTLLSLGVLALFALLR